MLLLIQMALVLTVATQTAKAAIIPHWPSDLFSNSYIDGIFQANLDNSAEVVTTLGPTNSPKVVGAQKQNSAEVGAVTQLQNSAEVSDVTQQQNSAEVGAVTQQQNSAEVGAVTQQQNSAEVGAVTQQQNSAEVGAVTQQQNSAEVGAVTRQQNSAEVDAVTQQQNSAEVDAVTQQQNSAEVGSITQQQNSAEVGVVTQQQNSAEVGAVTQQQNSAKVGAAPTTLDPFNSAEVTPKPIRLNPSVDNNQQIINSNANSETNNNQAERVGQEGGSGSNSTQPDNAGTVVSTATGTQPFYPQATDIKEIIKEEGGHPANPGNSVTVNTVSGTQSFYPITVSVGSQQGSDKTPDRPVNTDEANTVAGVEPILSWLDNQQISEDDTNKAGVEPFLPEKSQTDSIPNSLRDALSQVGVENTIDDPLVEHAKQLFISTWNLEAIRLQAPYLEVTEVWPKIGMVYMPTINKMSSKIQNSKAVKAAAEKLKSVWEESQLTAEDSSSDGSHVLSVLTDFISSWGIGATDPRYETFSSGEPVVNDNSQFNQDGGDEQLLQIKKPSFDRVAIRPPAIKPIRGEISPIINHPAHHRPAGGPIPVHRPAIRGNLNGESEESKEIE